MKHHSQLAAQFAALWDSSPQPPDVFEFLQQSERRISGGSAAAEQAEQLSTSEVLAVLLTDQQYRWQTEAALSVEDYQLRLPQLGHDSAARLRLAVGEFRARCEVSEPPDISEYLSRFKELGDPLRRQLRELCVGSIDISTDRNRPAAVSPPRTVSFITRDTGELPDLGRYQLETILGQGNFGVVYLAYDDELKRQVAIKVPTSERIRSSSDATLYLSEARMVARLNHAHIVPVHDMGRTSDGAPYVVSRYIEGGTLDDLMQTDRPDFAESARLLAVIAQALHHAHEHKIIHRDVKPANILIEQVTGTPFVADFGLAIHHDGTRTNRLTGGSPAYMSPEQARGETHRLDGRSDVFSLGVILYELLTGKRPFDGDSNELLLQNVKTVDPVRPRSIQADVPPELERICLKALSKRVSDRYDSAAAMADDLLHWNQAPVQAPAQLQITPRGLRSFTGEDADFFLDLLPGTRHRNGLPESIQFWKTRLEETDAERTFAVGLIYGPSGCGKSSLVKAGLLPRLARHITSIYVEATPEETELRIQRALHKAIPQLPPDLDLQQTFAFLRQRSGNKVVIVLDQFEQWLQAHQGQPQTPLVQALRQCDGGQLQALVMVRDDFSMAATRFMRNLETRIIEGHNFATVDLFDVRHAERVLLRYGQAYGRLPLSASDLSEDERAFLRGAVAGLAQDGSVITVQLALFAEMVRSRPWSSGTLVRIGGTAGVGVSFLDETFKARSANPEHRQHHRAACRVLKALLPPVGSNIKGHMKPGDVLLAASGYQNHPSHFAALLTILDSELRLITPTDPDGSHTETEGSGGQSPFYQLTHDYLVPALRKWLTTELGKNTAGRAALKLDELASVWNANPEHRYLPSLSEWIGIRVFTQTGTWTTPQQKMMAQAGRLHGFRLTGLFVILCIVTYLGIRISNTFEQKQRMLQVRQEQLLEQEKTDYSQRIVAELLQAGTEELPVILNQFASISQYTLPRLLAAFEELPHDSDARLNASIALLPTDRDQIQYLGERLLTADDDQFEFLRDLLVPYSTDLNSALWKTAREIRPFPETSGFLWESDWQRRPFQACCALAAYDPTHAHWQNPEFQKAVADHLVRAPASQRRFWGIAMAPVATHITVALTEFCHTAGDAISQRAFAAEILSEYQGENPEALFELLADSSQFASPKSSFHSFAGKLKAFPKQATELAAAELGKSVPVDADRQHREQLTQRQVNSATLLLTLNSAETLLTLLHQPQLADVRNHLIHAALSGELWTSPAPRPQQTDNNQNSPAPNPNNIAPVTLPMTSLLPEHLLWQHYQAASEGSMKQFLAVLLAASQRYDSSQTTVDHATEDTADLPTTAVADEVHLLQSLIQNVHMPAQRNLTAWLQIYRHESDAGLHSIAEWILRDQHDNDILQQLASAQHDLQESDASMLSRSNHDRNWYLNTEGQTFIILQATRFPMGSPTSEPGRETDEALHTRILDRRFAIAAHEVTRREWRRFSQAHPLVWSADDPLVLNYSALEDTPMLAMTWYEAAWYCNWLSQQAGIDDSQWCYETAPDGSYGPGMQAKQRFWELTGYRLPTEAEWEYAARAGSAASRSFGDSEELLENYAWFSRNSQLRTNPVAARLPNQLGLFDMHGNVTEWCYEQHDIYSEPDFLNGSVNYAELQALRDRELVRLKGPLTTLLSTPDFRQVTRDLPETPPVQPDSRRILRGGSFFDGPEFLRSAARFRSVAGDRCLRYGLRPVRTMP